MREVLIMLDEENGNVISEETSDEKIPKIKVYFVCENCDYNWHELRDVHVKESYVGSSDLKLNVEHAHCPICGSGQVSVTT